MEIILDANAVIGGEKDIFNPQGRLESRADDLIGRLRSLKAVALCRGAYRAALGRHNIEIPQQMRAYRQPFGRNGVPTSMRVNVRRSKPITMWSLLLLAFTTSVTAIGLLHPLGQAGLHLRQSSQTAKLWIQKAL